MLSLHDEALRDLCMLLRKSRGHSRLNKVNISDRGEDERMFEFGGEKLWKVDCLEGGLGEGRMILKSVFFIASWVGLSPLYCGHFWPIVPAPDDR
jgi:hypothetical protein